MIKSIAAAALLIAGQAGAAQEECLPRARAGQLAVAMLPSLIDAAARQCGPGLPAGAYLGGGAGTLSQRLRNETAADRAAAVRTMAALTGQVEPAPGQDPDRMIDVLSAGLAASLDAPRCRAASDLLEALAPLPASNIAQAFAAALGLAAAEAGEDAPPICRE
ncbi:MAG: hypothetical protein QOI38_377 [Sphingomonadales bacterium]|jgi:hypothetical protein|nr:hypothetical protein [Sphingomonadales bacterium]